MRTFLRILIVAVGILWFLIIATGIGISHANGQLSPLNHVFSILFLFATTSLFFGLAIWLKRKPDDQVSVKKELISVGKYWLVFFISAFVFSILTMIFFPIGR